MSTYEAGYAHGYEDAIEGAVRTASTAYTLYDPVPVDEFELLVEEAGVAIDQEVRENKNPMGGIPVTDGENYLWFFEDQPNQITSAQRWGANDPRDIIDALDAVGISMISEHDEGYEEMMSGGTVEGGWEPSNAEWWESTENYIEGEAQGRDGLVHFFAEPLDGGWLWSVMGPGVSEEGEAPDRDAALSAMQQVWEGKNASKTAQDEVWEVTASTTLDWTGEVHASSFEEAMSKAEDAAAAADIQVRADVGIVRMGYWEAMDAYKP